MRSLIVVTILCLISTPAFASCQFDTDCMPGTACIDGACSRFLPSDNDNDNVPMKSETGKGWKTCFDNRDCSQGSSCVKGTGFKGVCIGH